MVYKHDNPSVYIICYLHWGTEYRRFPSQEQEQIAAKLIDAGADMIIGHHPHVVESIRYYRGRSILFSLGNLVFDQRDAITKKGIIAGLAVRDGKVQVEITSYNIEGYRPVPMPLEDRESFKESILKISGDISFVDDGYGWTVHEIESGKTIGSDTTRTH
ncbi:MAG: CapA family protein [Bacteroidetes bacterium]|nr:CapA family protein [Bacteroidota bacterium]